MAWPFNRTVTKTRKITRRSDPEREKQRMLIKKTKFETDEFIKLAQSDPALKRQYILDTFHIKVPEEDPVKKAEQEINKQLLDQALEQIRTNPELAQEYAKRKLEEIAGSSTREQGEGFLGEDGSFLDRLDEVEAVKERLGGGNKGGLASEVILEIAKNLPLILASMSQMNKPLQLEQSQVPQLPVASTRIYVVETSSGPVEMTEKEYQDYKKNQQDISARPVPPAQPLTQSKPGMSLGIAEWVEYLDRDPSEFAQELLNRESIGNSQAEFVVKLVMLKSADEILTMLKPFKIREEYKEVVTQLEGRKDWVEGVVAYIRAAKQAQESVSLTGLTEGETSG